MKNLMLAGAVIFGLGAANAYAEGEGGPVANTQFTEIPGVVAHASTQNVPAVATAQNGQAVQVYGTTSSPGTWLFPPNPNGNG